MNRSQFSTLIVVISFYLSEANIQENHLGFGRWLHPQLTWSIHRYPDSNRHPKLTSIAMRRYVTICAEKAIKLWSPVVHVQFKQTQDNDKESDIKIFFYSRIHDDAYPFDGAGGELAHTFYPDEPRRGEIHLDDDEPWNPDGGRNLEWTLAHEMGHALGIPHQTGPSLMQNGYHGYKNQPKLTEIDIVAATTLYGS